MQLGIWISLCLSVVISTASAQQNTASDIAPQCQICQQVRQRVDQCNAKGKGGGLPSNKNKRQDSGNGKAGSNFGSRVSVKADDLDAGCVCSIIGFDPGALAGICESCLGTVKAPVPNDIEAVKNLCGTTGANVQISPQSASVAVQSNVPAPPPSVDIQPSTVIIAAPPPVTVTAAAAPSRTAVITTTVVAISAIANTAAPISVAQPVTTVNVVSTVVVSPPQLLPQSATSQAVATSDTGAATTTGQPSNAAASVPVPATSVNAFSTNSPSANGSSSYMGTTGAPASVSLPLSTQDFLTLPDSLLPSKTVRSGGFESSAQSISYRQRKKTYTAVLLPGFAVLLTLFLHS